MPSLIDHTYLISARMRNFSFDELSSQRVRQIKNRSPVLPRLLPSIVMGSLLRRAHFESLRAAEAKNSATINQLKYRSRSCITENIALGAWSRANKALGCASCFIGSRPRPRAVMHSHGTLTSIYTSGTSVLRMRSATRKRSRPDRESSQSS